jgi:hypothetical protein
MQKRTNPARQVAPATKFYAAVPNICGSLTWNLLHAILLAPRILRQLLHFGKPGDIWYNEHVNVEVYDKWH